SAMEHRSPRRAWRLRRPPHYPVKTPLAATRPRPRTRSPRPPRTRRPSPSPAPHCISNIHAEPPVSSRGATLSATAPSYGEKLCGGRITIMTNAPDVESTADELVLEPPKAVGSVSLDQTLGNIKIDEATATRINQAVNSYVESLTSMEAQSPEFTRKVSSIS